MTTETPDRPEEPQHWPTERMINEGHAEYAVPADLEGLDDSFLTDISLICDVDTLAPDECIPCLAGVLVMERIKARAEGEVEQISAPHEYDPYSLPEPEGFVKATEDGIVPLDDDAPVSERFAAQVKALNDLVAELLEGPPIPPPNVSTDELALLAVAAQRWIAIMDAQQVDLAPAQAAILAATKELVGRLNRG